MKEFRYIVLVLAGVMAVVLAFGTINIRIAHAATPTVVPQGQDGAYAILHKLTDVLIQKMNADIDATNRLTAEIARQNEIALFLECHAARDMLHEVLWDSLDCESRTGLELPEEGDWQ